MDQPFFFYWRSCFAENIKLNIKFSKMKPFCMLSKVKGEKKEVNNRQISSFGFSLCSQKYKRMILSFGGLL
jgi:hypothetical protein